MNIKEQRAQPVQGMNLRFDRDIEGSGRVCNLWDLEQETAPAFIAGERAPLYLPNHIIGQEIAGRFIITGVDRDVILMTPGQHITLWEGDMNKHSLGEIYQYGTLCTVYFALMMRMDLTVQSLTNHTFMKAKIIMTFNPRAPSSRGFSYGHS